MSSQAWRPVVKTGREDVLVDGFPLWMRESLIDWFASMNGVTHTYDRVPLLLDFQVANGEHYGFETGLMAWEKAAEWLREVSDDVYTNLLDYALWRTRTLPSNNRWERVHAVLTNGGSKWTVMKLDDHWRLSEHVPAGVLELAEEAMSAKNKASLKLQEVWGDAFGTNPRASVAYYDAVVAVETAAFGVVPSPVPEPTLETLFSILEAEKPKWRLILRDSDKAPGSKSLSTMLRLLWRGHDSRHGAEDYEDCTLEEARAGVMLAATLVYWFRNGVLRPNLGE